MAECCRVAANKWHKMAAELWRSQCAHRNHHKAAVYCHDCLGELLRRIAAEEREAERNAR